MGQTYAPANPRELIASGPQVSERRGTTMIESRVMMTLYDGEVSGGDGRGRCSEAAGAEALVVVVVLLSTLPGRGLPYAPGHARSRSRRKVASMSSGEGGEDGKGLREEGGRA